MPDTRLSPTASTTEAAMVLSVWRHLGMEPNTNTHTNAVDNDDLTLTMSVTGARLFEVGDRIEWNFDGTYERAEVTAWSTPTLTVRRGIDGTTAASHSANAVISKSTGIPIWGVNIQKAIQDSIDQDFYPDLYAVYEAQLTPSTLWSAESPQPPTKEIDVSAEEILHAYQKADSTPTRLYEVLTSQPFYVDTTIASISKKAIELRRIPDNNNTIFVQYLRSPAVGDLSEGMKAICEYGAIRRLLEWQGANWLMRMDILQSGTVAPGQPIRDARWFDLQQDTMRRREKALLNRRFPRRQPKWRPESRLRHYHDPAWR